MSIIVISDLHIKNSDAHLYGTRKFFDWLLENYKNEIIIQLGDLWDTSSPHSTIEDEFIGYIKQFKEFHILQGNHDISKRSGFASKHLNHHNSIFVYEDKTEIEIEESKILMLPWKYNHKEEYENLEGKFDFIFTHITPQECTFADEGLIFNKLKGCFIHGHTHIQRDFTDKNINQHCVLGVPFPTRNLENQNYRILKIDNKKIETIKVPIWFEYEDVEYGEQPKSKNNILNIKNAPSIDSAYDLYKSCYIRDEGITFKQNEEVNLNDVSFDMSDLSGQFITFCEQPDMNISKDVQTTCLKYLRV